MKKGIMSLIFLFLLTGCFNDTHPLQLDKNFQLEYEVYSEEPELLEAISVLETVEGINSEDVTVDTTAVDMEHLGNFVVKFEIKNDQGKVFSKEITVSIVDKTKPVIEGLHDRVIELNGSFDPLGNLTVTDNYDSNLVLTLNSVNLGNFDNTKLGTYDITYTLEDSSQNQTIETIKVTVEDSTPPVITGVKTVYLLESELESYNFLEGIEATDNSNSVKSLTVNASKPYWSISNRFEGSYTAIDHYNNVTTEYFDIAIVKPKSDYITLYNEPEKIELGENITGSVNTDNTPYHFYEVDLGTDDNKFVNISNLDYLGSKIYLFEEVKPGYFEQLMMSSGYQEVTYVGSADKLYVLMESFYSSESYDFEVNITRLDSNSPEVIFKDHKLDFAIRDKLNVVDMKISEQLATLITKLDISNSQIDNLEGIQHFTNVLHINLLGNNLEEVNALKTLYENKVEGSYLFIDLRGNPIKSVSYDSLRYLEDNLVTVLFDNLPDYGNLFEIGINETKTGQMDAISDRDIYKLDQIKGKIFSIRVSATDPVNSYFHYSLFYFNNGTYQSMTNQSQTTMQFRSYSLILSQYNTIYIVVDGSIGSHYELEIIGENLDPNSPALPEISSDLAYAISDFTVGSYTQLNEQMAKYVNNITITSSSTISDLQYFNHIKYLSLRGSFVEEDLTHISHLDHLESIYLEGTRLTNIDDLMNLHQEGHLQNLKIIILHNNSFLSVNTTSYDYFENEGIEVYEVIIE